MATASTDQASLPMIPAIGETRRVGGDLKARVTGADGKYKCGSSSVTTPLPVGYPAPTPPGSIDLKSYPMVRRAEVDGNGNPDAGMNDTFWPLFKHIKKHEIAMTSPVEMDYPEGMDQWGKDSKWTMSFLYREREMNAEGQEGNVRVRDARPLTVLAVGVKGNYDIDRMKTAKASLDAWLAANPAWRVAGGPRALHYNGPTLMYWHKWSEVQVPVEPASSITIR
ncbi:MAG: heme-binding protein [Phycisphaerales bacterium]